jgi:hypothetical protein
MEKREIKEYYVREIKEYGVRVTVWPGFISLRFAFRIETAAVIIPLKRICLPLIVSFVLSARKRHDAVQARLQNYFSAGENALRL